MATILLWSVAFLTEPPIQATPAQPSRLAVIRKAPEFSLTSQSNKELRLSDLRGKVLLIGFIFTTCNGTCPATTHRMSLVQQELKRRGVDRRGGVQLLSVTLDPARDTPEALRNYARLYDVDPTTWTFLTGAPAKVFKVQSDWDMWTRPTPNGQFDHPSRVFLVDGRGQVREIYHLGFMKPAWVADDVALLLEEKP